MTPKLVVKSLWKALDGQDWKQLGNLLDKDFLAFFPQSGEQFNRQEWIAMNQNYPGEWHLKIHQLIENDLIVVTEVFCEIDDRTDTAISFFTVRSGLVTSLKEYWPEPFGIPEWRQS